MGCAAAFWLSRLSQGRLSICVAEPDPGHAFSSTALSVASIRQQFATEINVKISAYSIEFLRNIETYLGPQGKLDSVDVRENGYLLLSGTPDGATSLRAAQKMQRRLGAQTDLLTPDALAQRFPWLSVGDVTLASFGAVGEGWFDNMALLQGLRRAARHQGVNFLADRVIGLRGTGRRVHVARLAKGGNMTVGNFINAAGTGASDLMRHLGEEIPVEPRKRTVFVIDAPNARHPDAPLLVCHSGFYLRPENTHWLCASVPVEDGPCDARDFEPDLDAFERDIWPRLYARVPGFHAVKVLSEWAGHYAYNRLDQNGIVGAHPNWRNLYLMNGFSGYGLQQAPAVGRGIAELLLSGSYQTLDMSDLSVARVLEGKAFRENNII